MRPTRVLPVLAALTLASCVATAPSAVSPEVKLAVDVPALSPLPETRESQEKGGVEISVAPVSYEAEPYSVEDSRVAEPSFSDALKKPGKNAVLREYVKRPGLRVKPSRLRFTVKVNNKLSRVFRAAGSVVQFNVAGKLAAVDQSGYADLTNAIIPPRGEAQVEVFGPKIGDIPLSCTVGLFLYDVPTKTDAAGNVVEKQNFEWYFKYQTTKEERTGLVRVERRWQ